jgi:Txe/YoeB family toxin of Txe-Axe toxin-antitoxin module
MKLVRKSEVAFADDNLQKEFENLNEKEELKEYIKRAVKDLQENAFCGIQIPKKLIPEIYIQKYKIDNLWKYDLPDGWRLVYSIMPQNKVEILSLIIEWFDHKDYERRFHY